jgi:formylglycine-generating enzyme
MLRLPLTSASLVVVAAMVLGCQGEEVGAAPSSETGGEETGADASTKAETSTDAARDAGGDTFVPPVEAGTCVNNERGPELVSVGAFCIDATEVTNAQYNAFIDFGMDPNSVSKTPEYCAFNTTFGTKVNETDTLDAPRVNVDWCDAWTFCAWAGKHLCGKIGPAEARNELADHALLDKSEWFYACTGGDLKNVYPYGDTFDVKTCHVEYDTLGPVKSAPACHGTRAPFDAIHDMAGNAFEWENTCSSDDLDAHCLIRGGSTDFSDPGISRCDYYYDNKTRKDFEAYIGFRCCQ